MKKITKTLTLLLTIFFIGLSVSNSQTIYRIESDGTFYSVGDTVILNRFNFQNDFKFKVGTKNVDNLRAWVIFDGHDDLKIDKDLKNTTGINSILEFDINFDYQQILTQDEGFIFTIKFYWKYDSENWHVLRENDKLLDSGVIYLRVDNIENYKNYVKLETYRLDSENEKVYNLPYNNIGEHKLSIIPLSNSLFDSDGTKFEIVADYTGYYTTLAPLTEDFQKVYPFSEPLLEEGETILDFNREVYRRFLTYTFYYNDGVNRYLLGTSNTLQILPKRLDYIIDSLNNRLTKDILINVDLPIVLKSGECGNNENDIVLGYFSADLKFNYLDESPILVNFENTENLISFNSDLICELLKPTYTVSIYKDSTELYNDFEIFSDTVIHIDVDINNYISPEYVNVKIVFEGDTIYSEVPTLIENTDCELFGKKLFITNDWKNLVKNCIDENRINEYLIHSLDGSTDGKYDKQTIETFLPTKQPFILIVRYDYNKFGFIMFVKE